MNFIALSGNGTYIDMLGIISRQVTFDLHEFYSVKWERDTYALSGTGHICAEWEWDICTC